MAIMPTNAHILRGKIADLVNTFAELMADILSMYRLTASALTKRELSASQLFDIQLMHFFIAAQIRVQYLTNILPDPNEDRDDVLLICARSLAGTMVSLVESLDEDSPEGAVILVHKAIEAGQSVMSTIEKELTSRDGCPTLPELSTEQKATLAIAIALESSQ